MTKFIREQVLGRIQVYTKRNALIAEAVVDLHDFELVSQYRWYVGKGYLFATYRDIITGKRIWIQLHRFLMKPSKSMTIDHIKGGQYHV